MCGKTSGRKSRNVCVPNCPYSKRLRAAQYYPLINGCKETNYPNDIIIEGDNLEEPDNLAQVFLFKEAITLGWDCPRAAVLIIFRKLLCDEFTIQTVGRILHMPEQHHYTDGRLNIGYVYTDIAKDKINIVTADADYIKKNAIPAVRRANLNNVTLRSV